ncbi:MAG: metal-dependent hydrolase [Candidatus Norongarragalinales archaeon]
MRFYEHIAVGFAANAALFWILSKTGFFSLQFFQNTPLALTFLLAIALFSLLPDVDSLNSFASKLFQLALLAFAAASVIEFSSVKSVVPLAKAVFALLLLVGHFLYAKSGRMHRQFPHTFAFGALACAAAFMLTGSKTVALASAVAFASHLAADGHLLAALKQDASLLFRKGF